MFEKNTSMKGMKSISILAILILFSSFANADWVNFCSDTPGSPTVEVLSSNSTSTVLRIIIPGMNSEEKTVDGTNYKELRFLDRGTMLDIGDPELPAVREFIAIPATADVTVSIIDSSEVIGLSGYNVYPFQTPLAEGETASSFDKNETRYATDSFYPAEMVEVGEPEILKDLRIVTLSVYPILFNPVTDSLRVYWDLTIELNYNGRNGRNILTNQRDEISPASHRLYEKLIANYEFLDLTVRDLPSDYLIITPQEYYDEIQPFADWKHKSGIQTHIAVMPPACDTTYVKDTISSYFPDIDFVLLVGDEDDIPVYTEYRHYLGLYYGPLASDHWYCLLNGDDDIADIAIGRLSVGNEVDVDTIVDKIFSYERLPSSGWNVKDILFVSDDEYPYQECKEFINDNFLDYYGFNVITAYGDQVNGDNATNQDVIDAIEENNGVGIVNFRGHGRGFWPLLGYTEINCWHDWNDSDQDFTIYDAESLENPSYPILYNISCFNGMLDSEDGNLCLADAFTRNPDGGASGSLGSTRQSMSAANHYFDKTLFYATSTCAGPYSPQIHEVGNVISYAKYFMQRDYDYWGLCNSRMYIWFGDPEMRIWTEQPYDFTVSHPTLIAEPVTEDITITVTDSLGYGVTDALVCLYKDSEFYLRDITDITGQVTFTLNILASSEGIMTVTVTKYNFRPYEGEIEIHFPPRAPENLMITTDEPDIILTWSPVTEDIAGNPETIFNYRFYRSTSNPDTEYDIVSTPFDTTVTDYGAMYNYSRAFYRITAVSFLPESRNSGLESKSAFPIIKKSLPQKKPLNPTISKEKRRRIWRK